MPFDCPAKAGLCLHISPSHMPVDFHSSIPTWADMTEADFLPNRATVSAASRIDGGRPQCNVVPLLLPLRARERSSSSTGFTKCRSNPASRDFTRSASCPHPVTAMI